MRVHRLGRAAVTIRSGDFNILVNDDLYLGDSGLYMQDANQFYFLPFDEIKSIEVEHDESISLTTSDGVEVNIRGRSSILLRSVAHLLKPYVCAEVGC